MRKIVEYKIHDDKKGTLGSKIEKDVEQIIRRHKNSGAYGRTFTGLLKVVEGLREYIEGNFELKEPAPDPPNKKEK